MIMLALTEMGVLSSRFFPIFSHITESASGAVLLSYFCDLSDKHRGDWFSVTRETLSLETGLTRSEQERGRRVLVDLGIIAEKRVGLPAKRHFRLNEFTLQDAVRKTTRRLLKELENG